MGAPCIAYMIAAEATESVSSAKSFTGDIIHSPQALRAYKSINTDKSQKLAADIIAAAAADARGRINAFAKTESAAHAAPKITGPKSLSLATEALLAICNNDSGKTDSAAANTTGKEP